MEIYIKIPFTKLVEIETVARTRKENSIFIFLTSSANFAPCRRRRWRPQREENSRCQEFS